MKLPAFEEDEESLQMTSMIDVVFLLLIFFLVATKLEEEERLVSINLAEIFQAQPLAVGVEELIVNVTKEGKYNVAGTEYGEDQLIAILHEARARNPHRRVQVRADELVQFKFPLTVIGICKKAELEYTCTVLERQP